MSATLAAWSKQPPVGVIALASMTGYDVKPELDANGKGMHETLRLAGGAIITGTAAAMRFVVRSAGTTWRKLLGGEDPMAMHEVDEWLHFAPNLVSGAAFEGACKAVEAHLELRSFLVGFDVTVADLAAWSTLSNNMQWDQAYRKGTYPNLSRWYSFVSSLPECAAALEKYDWRKTRGMRETSERAAQVVGKAKGEGGSFDIDLPGAVRGKVVTRFPPEPSGYLHVGHAKAALLNDILAKIYEGKLVVRFDDTNPSKEKDEFVDNIMKDIDLLGLSYDRVTYTSDYFPQLLDLAERMIKAGHLYADDTPVDKMREERLAKKASSCRGRTVEENLRLWEEMKKGSPEGVANCIRVKMDPADNNGCLRDPVCFRCNIENPHHRTGTKFKVYPTYDFACPFVDAFEGITHALRTNEYRDREPQFYWMQRLQREVWPELPEVVIYDYARLNFVNTVLSKRKLQWFVDQGLVESWTDPRFPTVQGLVRRGMQIEALREFIALQGVSKNSTLQEWEKIWSINKRLIDPVAPRHTSVDATPAKPVKVTLTNGPAQVEIVTVPKHAKNPEVGKKASYRSSTILIDAADAELLKEGEEVTLMSWGNCIVRKVTRGAAGVEAIEAELHLEGDVKKTKLKLTWLADVPELIDLEVRFYGHLLTKKKIEEDDDVADIANKDSLSIIRASGDPNMRNLNKGDVIQLERKGFYIVEQAMGLPGQHLVLINIPDGRQK